MDTGDHPDHLAALQTNLETLSRSNALLRARVAALEQIAAIQEEQESERGGGRTPRGLLTRWREAVLALKLQLAAEELQHVEALSTVRAECQAAGERLRAAGMERGLVESRLADQTARCHLAEQQARDARGDVARLEHACERLRVDHTIQADSRQALALLGPRLREVDGVVTGRFKAISAAVVSLSQRLQFANSRMETVYHMLRLRLDAASESREEAVAAESATVQHLHHEIARLNGEKDMLLLQLQRAADANAARITQAKTELLDEMQEAQHQAAQAQGRAELAEAATQAALQDKYGLENALALLREQHGRLRADLEAQAEALRDERQHALAEQADAARARERELEAEVDALRKEAMLLKVQLASEERDAEQALDAATTRAAATEAQLHERVGRLQERVGELCARLEVATKERDTLAVLQQTVQHRDTAQQPKRPPPIDHLGIAVGGASDAGSMAPSGPEVAAALRDIRLLSDSILSNSLQ